MVRKIFSAVALIVVASVSASPAMAQFGQGNTANNLFQQYYTQPGASMTQAGMYNAPHWVPSYVGHSYNTYQPLMPHEMMYTHSRNYYNYYNTGGYYGSPNALNKTTVKWQSGTNHMGPLPFSGNLVQAAKWKWNSQRYCLDGSCGGGLGGGLGGGALKGKLHGAAHGLGGRLHGMHGQCSGGDCQTEGGCQDCGEGVVDYGY